MIYSTQEAQPCSDHERRKGEGVKPQEYTLIKIKIQEPYPKSLESLAQRPVFLVAATLRPETMYGQTNCYVLPTGVYGAFAMKNDEVFICSERSMRNMSYQELTNEYGKHNKLFDIEGSQLLGLKLTAPLSHYETVYSLPMLGISMNKGTGIVTSVPSDSPDDYAALMDLQKKPQLREKYGITEEMTNFPIIPIINIPSIGDLSAVIISEQLGIKSQNDRELLDKAKDLTYTKGFSEGILIVGHLAGQKVSIAKPIIKKELISRGEALNYYEPENEVISRGGESCIVALCDQWFLAYDDESWREKVSKHIATGFKAYNPVVLKEFEETVNWLGEWACSRQYGLGSKLACDPQYVIESLSDSTVYMAYYTISHWLQGGVLDGSVKGPAGIAPSQLTTKVLDYVFLLTEEVPVDSGINTEVLEKMRNEFKYWYPMDLRCSGKDLIRNHLTMSLFNHTAIWKNPSLWPRSFYCNGHIQLNMKKMSKGEGNFLTLADAIDKYGADATRIAIADSGDSIDDANFTGTVANSAILKLYTLHEWIVDTLQSVSSFRTGDKNFFDLAFDNEINIAIEKAKNAYETLQFRDVLVHAFFDLYSKEEYRIFAGSYHQDLYFRYLSVQLLLLSPIAPHFCEKHWELYQEAKGLEKTLIVSEAYPVGSASINLLLIRQLAYIRSILKTARLALEKSSKKQKKNPKKAVVYISSEFPADLQQILHLLHDYYQISNPDAKEYINIIKKLNLSKAETQKMMQFASFVVGEFKERGLEAFEDRLPFDEAWLIHTITPYALQELELEELKIENKNEKEENKQLRDAALPGRPQFYFYDFR